MEPTEKRRDSMPWFSDGSKIVTTIVSFNYAKSLHRERNSSMGNSIALATTGAIGRVRRFRVQ
jgi:hypothetical protein